MGVMVAVPVSMAVLEPSYDLSPALKPVTDKGRALILAVVEAWLVMA